VWLGERLSNSRNPDGYGNIVYKKACWIVHMLRDLMTEPATGADERFFRMLRDFLAAHRGEVVSTEDFVRHAEKYMTRAMDLEHDGRLDWFFNEWVYNTGIPTYQLTSKTRRLGPDKFLVQGTIEQADVPSDFEMLVPVVALTTRNKRVRLGRVAVGDSGGHFRFTMTSKPAHIIIDEDNLLAVVH
jgi:aminopeptidase N